MFSPHASNSPRLVVYSFVCVALWATTTTSARVPVQQTPAQAETSASELERGIKLYHQGDMKGAAKLLKATLKKKKDDVNALYYLGMTQVRQGDTKDARKSFEAALQLQPSFAHARAGLAYLAFLAGKLREAESEAGRALELDGSSLDAHYIIGLLKLREEAWVKVLEKADAMLKIDPNAAQAYYLKSRASLGLYFRANAIVADERRGAYPFNAETVKEATETQALRLKEAADNLKMYLQLNPTGSDATTLREELETLFAYAQAASQTDPARRIYSTSQLTAKAAILSKPEPGYTEEARRAGISGMVRLRLVLGADGKVRNILVMRTLSHGLTERAIAAARKIKFKPAIIGGLPVSQFVMVEYYFNIY